MDGCSILFPCAKLQLPILEIEQVAALSVTDLVLSMESPGNLGTVYMPFIGHSTSTCIRLEISMYRQVVAGRFAAFSPL